LYDPDRSRVILNKGSISTWEKFTRAIHNPLEIQRVLKGAGLRILTETITSPTLGSQLQALLAQFPQAKWHQYDPVNHDAAREGAQLAFGEDVRPQYRFDRAAVVVSLDADFIGTGAGHIRYAHDFAERRRIQGEKKDMNRLYVAESMPSVTGTMADHRVPVRSHLIEFLVRAIARKVGVSGVAPATVHHEQWVDVVAGDLRNHRGASIVVAGPHQPPEVHALAYAINAALGNIGSTVTFADPAEVTPVSHLASLRELVRDIDAGSVDMLVILGGNPAYNTPADFNFADSLSRVTLSVHLGLYDDETSQLCAWHIPESHYLEAWSDARAFDGTATIMQPLIAPLYNTTSAHELLEELMGRSGRKGYDVVREYWRGHQSGDFESFWRTSLNDGVVTGTVLPRKQPTVAGNPAVWQSILADSEEGLEINFRPDPTIWDGRFANNGWLQELPKPVSKLMWDNAAFLSPATALAQGLNNCDVVELKHGDRVLEAAVWILPGHADGAVTVHLGYGRARAGNVGNGMGFNAYALRSSEAVWFGSGLHLSKTTRRYTLASSQDHNSMEGRALIREGTLDTYKSDPSFVKKMGHKVPGEHESFYPPHEYDGYAWGMTIDLNACTGCNACVISCQSENNIPITGKDQVENGREMHWIRIDRYYKGDLDDPEILHQPVTCMHCGNAPCEVVCPVAATTHDAEGLNVMTYNRCVGTRYCSNNCPYKVRRFNFLQYSDTETETLAMMKNPDVTVRNRGVMEKCTYCVQRISAARIDAKKEGRDIRDGEVKTACQSACPAQAITFGNINDKESAVAKMKAEPREYSLLGELNTKPRTTYLAKLRNPNPEIDTSGTA
jgi:molybdopterin-containing oxidoreductase family iron-sulfur binding subunit